MTQIRRLALAALVALFIALSTTAPTGPPLPGVCYQDPWNTCEEM